MNDEKSLDVLKEYLKELRSEFNDFSKDYHSENVKVWKEIVRVQGSLETVQDKQKKQAQFWGIIGGAIPASIVIASALLLYWLSKLPSIPAGAGP